MPQALPVLPGPDWEEFVDKEGAQGAAREGILECQGRPCFQGATEEREVFGMPKRAIRHNARFDD